MKKLKNTN